MEPENEYQKQIAELEHQNMRHLKAIAEEHAIETSMGDCAIRQTTRRLGTSCPHHARSRVHPFARLPS